MVESSPRYAPRVSGRGAHGKELAVGDNVWAGQNGCTPRRNERSNIPALRNPRGRDLKRARGITVAHECDQRANWGNQTGLGRMRLGAPRPWSHCESNASARMRSGCAPDGALINA